MKVANPVGKKGEDLACEFLKKKKYKIIDRNVKAGNGELDIVAIHENVLVFIEVKTRISTAFGTPEEAITYTKLKSLIKTVQLYCQKHPELPESMRIDAVEILLDSKQHPLSITHALHISE